MNEVEQLLNLAQSVKHPWLILALALFIPLSIVICLREAACWFCKINKIVARLENIEYYLQNLQATPPSNPAANPAANPASNPATSGSNTERLELRSSTTQQFTEE